MLWALEAARENTKVVVREPSTWLNEAMSKGPACNMVCGVYLAAC